MAARWAHNPEVVGSSPTPATMDTNPDPAGPIGPLPIDLGIEGVTGPVDGDNPVVQSQAEHDPNYWTPERLAEAAAANPPG